MCVCVCVRGDRGRMTAKGYKAGSYLGDENVLKLSVVMLTELYDYSKKKKKALNRTL